MIFFKFKPFFSIFGNFSYNLNQLAVFIKHKVMFLPISILRIANAEDEQAKYEYEENALARGVRDHWLLVASLSLTSNWPNIVDELV